MILRNPGIKKTHISKTAKAEEVRDPRTMRHEIHDSIQGTTHLEHVKHLIHVILQRSDAFCLRSYKK